MKFSGVSLFDNTSKNFKLNILLVLVLVLKAKACVNQRRSSCMTLQIKRTCLDVRLRAQPRSKNSSYV